MRVLAPGFTLGVEQLVRDSEPGPQSAQPMLHPLKVTYFVSLNLKTEI